VRIEVGADRDGHPGITGQLQSHLSCFLNYQAGARLAPVRERACRRPRGLVWS
jgi:hypothetical protein